MESGESLRAGRNVRDSYYLRPPLGRLRSQTIFCFLVGLQRNFSLKETNSSLLQINDDKDHTDPSPPPPCPIFLKTGCPRGEEEECGREKHVLPGNVLAGHSRLQQPGGKKGLHRGTGRRT